MSSGNAELTASPPPSSPGSPGARPPLINLLPTALTVIALLVALSFFGQVAGPLLAIALAVMLATALNPLTVFFERWLPRGLAASLTVLLVLGALGGLGWLAIPPIAAQVTDLLQGVPTDLRQIERRVEGWLAQYPQLAPLLRQDNLPQLQERVVQWAAGAAGSVLNLTGAVVGGVFTAAVTLIMVLFVLANPLPLVTGIIEAVPLRYRAPAARALAEILKQMGAWGRATVLIMLIMGVVMGAGLFFLGVDNWLVFGVITALGELVPNIGPIVAALPPILFTLADDPQKALWVALFALVIQQLESYVLAPFLLGGAAKMHPLSVTVGVLLFGSVFGLVGAFLTVPFLIVIKALYRHFYLEHQPRVPEPFAAALISGEVQEELEERREAQERGGQTGGPV